ncbi:hypothetical protein [Pseudonocardia sp.]|uniref:hypothetical protein n=1 Tax=Pseudonocardia sp. TaxID=60912 RepID=UPI0031FBAC8C
MCVLCYELAPEDHWSDNAVMGEPTASPHRSRHRRTRILSAVLAPYGLTVSDPGSGPHRVISDRKGASEIAAALPAVWQAADRLGSRPVDVLDPVLLDALAEGSA